MIPLIDQLSLKTRPGVIRRTSEETELREISMERDIASRIVKGALALDARIGELDDLISQLNDGKEKDECVRALGDILGMIPKNFVFRILRQYPEMDPDR